MYSIKVKLNFVLHVSAGSCTAECSHDPEITLPYQLVWRHVHFTGNRDNGHVFRGRPYSACQTFTSPTEKAPVLYTQDPCDVWNTIAIQDSNVKI